MGVVFVSPLDSRLKHLNVKTVVEPDPPAFLGLTPKKNSRLDVSRGAGSGKRNVALTVPGDKID